MTTERWRKIEHIFQAAADLGPTERSAFLTKACEGDQALRSEVDLLLAQMYLRVADTTPDPAEATQDRREVLRIIGPWTGQSRFAEMRLGTYFSIAAAQWRAGDPARL